MSGFFLLYKTRLLLTACLLQYFIAPAQTNLLLNGGFEDVNTCTEYTAECGVEGWFYLRDVKAQMLGNDSLPGQEKNTKQFGTNSFGIFYNWLGYKDFTPVIGTILPCGLQKGNRYTFKGMISALLNPKLILTPGICVGEKFYVPKRAFSKNLKPDNIILVNRIPESKFYRFEYSFVADGKEKYLTFGTFIEEDTIGSKKKLIGTQTVALILDNFQLIPEDSRETSCPDFLLNKEEIYNYNFRHKEMDYSLYGRGELAIVFTNEDSNYITKIKEPPPLPSKSDTLKLGDVFFDFNKANLQPDALKLLEKYFIRNNTGGSIDSIYVEGHTDSIGSNSRNLALSLERCERIRRWLLENNIITPAFIKVHPFGKSKPVASNNSPQGRAMNRRVEMIVFRKTEK
jgi:outer membrane protein OmpA-like peptidoglycan-associated protein